MKSIMKLICTGVMAGACANASAAFVINEIDSDTPGTDALEFVELKGNPGESATGLILVFFNGGAAGSPSYRTVDLAGLTADSNGYILLADANVPGSDMVLPNGFIQNGEDAVVLYQDVVANFPNGTLPTTTNMVDALVYKAGNQADEDWTGLGSPTVYNEAGLGAVTQHGLSRIPDGTGSWVPTVTTPRGANVQTSSYTVSEPFWPRVNQATAQEFSTRTITLRNTGTRPLAVNTFELATTSSAAFTTFLAADPAAPVVLPFNQATTLTVQFLETNVSTNKSYTGAVLFTTDDPAVPAGSVEFATELVRATQTAAVGAVRVNEICYNPGSVDHNGDGSTTNQNDEYVELKNMTGSPIVIEGWEQRCQDGDAFTFHSFVFPAGATIPANGFVTVFTAGTPTGFTPGTTFTYGIPRIRNAGSLVNIHDATKQIDGVAFPTAEDNPDVDGFTNAGVTAVSGGSIGRRPDGSSTFRAFAPTDPITTDQPSPNRTNNDTSGIAEWSLF